MSTQLKFCVGTAFGVIWIPHGTSLTRAKNFAYGIEKYTNAEIRRVWATIGDRVNIPEKDGDVKSIKNYAHVFIRRESDMKLFAVKILSPNYGECFDDDQEVLPESGEDIAEEYSKLAGETYIFEHGALAGPSSQ